MYKQSPLLSIVNFLVDINGKRVVEFVSLLENAYFHTRSQYQF